MLQLELGLYSIGAAKPVSNIYYMVNDKQIILSPFLIRSLSFILRIEIHNKSAEYARSY